MRKKKTYHYYRRIRTTQERRAGQNSKYVRAKRNFANLPNAYDDVRSTHQKTWKIKRLKQYRDKPRGRRHEYIIDNCWRSEWQFRDYCEEHDIPHTVEPIKEEYTYKRNVTNKVVLYTRTVYATKYVKIDGKTRIVTDYSHPIGKRDFYGWIPTGEVEYIKATKTIGYRLIWWYNKDIGIERIVNRKW